MERPDRLVFSNGAANFLFLRCIPDLNPDSAAVVTPAAMAEW
jgi:hypothetical protein